eukprot:6493314-Prymnesium_polylepis.1
MAWTDGALRGSASHRSQETSQILRSFPPSSAPSRGPTALWASVAPLRRARGATPNIRRPTTAWAPPALGSSQCTARHGALPSTGACIRSGGELWQAYIHHRRIDSNKRVAAEVCRALRAARSAGATQPRATKPLMPLSHCGRGVYAGAGGGTSRKGADPCWRGPQDNAGRGGERATSNAQEMCSEPFSP